jgi:hypothetical protein
VILCNVEWQFRTDGSGQHIGPFFKGQTVQEVLPVFRLEFLIIEDGTGKLKPNVGTILEFLAA